MSRGTGGVSGTSLTRTRAGLHIVAGRIHPLCVRLSERLCMVVGVSCKS